MTLDKRHMTASVLMLVGAIAYNVWIFTRPATRLAAAAAPADIMGAPSTDSDGGERTAGIDLAQASVLPDVEIDRSPTWRRDPFADLRAMPEKVEATPVAPAPVVQADPVVASILYSTGRRLAVIDGQIVRPNDRVAGAIVVDILPKAVVLESAEGERRTVDLQAPMTRRGRR
jgi:hypothetical protein